LCVMLLFALLLGSISAAAAELPAKKSLTVYAGQEEKPSAMGGETKKAQDGAAEDTAVGNDLVALLLQVGNDNVFTGEVLEPLEKKAGMAAAPRYAENGAILVPLESLANRLGKKVVWNANKTKVILTDEKTRLYFTQGSWSYQAGGESFVMPTPAVTQDGVFYIPLLTLGKFQDVYFHTFGFYDGGYISITNYPVSAQDKAGTPHDNYNAQAPDEALAERQKQAIKVFGPNVGLFEAQTVFLRRESRHALVGGKEADLCQKGGSIMPHQSADGYLMVPIEFCAKAFGGTYEKRPDGSSVVTCNGHTAVFPTENGYFTVDGRRKNHPYCGGALKDGVAYCSVYSFTTAFGLYGYANGATKGIVLTPYNLASRQDLQERAWSRISTLQLGRYEDAKGYLALTFDDGPSGEITTRLLDGLKKRDVHATFFLCNYRIQSYPDLLPRYLKEGHEIGNHSANHTILTTCDTGRLASELDQTNFSIEKYAGVKPTLMRPPGGGYNGAVLSAAADRDMSCVMWSIDPQDWKYHDRQTVAQSILSHVKDGDIILLHDMYNTSVDAALLVIDTLQAQGYCFVTVSELADIKGVDLAPGGVYAQIR